MSRPMATPTRLAKSEPLHRMVMKTQQQREAAEKSWRIEKGKAAIANLALTHSRAVVAADLKVMKNLAHDSKSQKDLIAAMENKMAAQEKLNDVLMQARLAGVTEEDEEEEDILNINEKIAKCSDDVEEAAKAVEAIREKIAAAHAEVAVGESKEKMNALRKLMGEFFNGEMPTIMQNSVNIGAAELMDMSSDQVKTFAAKLNETIAAMKVKIQKATPPAHTERLSLPVRDESATASPASRIPAGQGSTGRKRQRIDFSNYN